MRLFISSVVVAMLPVFAMAGSAHGVWKTEKGKDGGQLEVTISACGSSTCGKITTAYNANGKVDGGYKYLGKVIISGMSDDGGDKYSGGKIWDPENGKTYKSKMSLSGQTLIVEGCVGPVCSKQHWQKVK